MGRAIPDCRSWQWMGSEMRGKARRLSGYVTNADIAEKAGEFLGEYHA